MAQEYIALKENNNDGIIALSKSAFQTIAKIAVSYTHLTLPTTPYV